MKILQTIYEFHNKDYNTTCGLYHVELDSGTKHYFIRNEYSVGTISHFLGRPASECISIIRDDVKKEFLSKLEKEDYLRYKVGSSIENHKGTFV